MKGLYTVVKKISKFPSFLFLVFFLSCFSYKTVQNKNVECPISVSAKFNGGSIAIIIKNISDDSIKVSNPSHFINVDVEVLDKYNNPIGRNNRIHPVIRGSREDLIAISSYDSIKAIYGYTLNGLFILKRGELYKVKIHYAGNIFKRDQLLYCPNSDFNTQVIW